MGLARLVWMPDARLVAGALGIGAAILLPLAGTLIISGLQPRLDPTQGWIGYQADGGPLDLSVLPAPRLSVAEADVDGQAFSAFQIGPSGVEAGHALSHGPVSLRGEALVVDGPPGTLPLLAPGRVLVHPSDLPGAPVTAAIFGTPVASDGLIVNPARGADAFEDATTNELRAATGMVVLASLPAVGLVAAVFTKVELRERLHASAVLASLGGLREARRMLAVRILLVSGLGTCLAVAFAWALWRWGGPFFHPVPAPKSALVIAIVVPALTALAVGLLATRGTTRRIDGALRGGREPDAGPHLRIPLLARPLVLGVRLLPILAICAALFAADVGFPLAAGQVPAAMLGGPGEWVVGAESGLQVGQVGVSSAPADVLGHDPDIEAIVAETVAPTMLGGESVALRCGEWEQLASYHGMSLAEGTPPGPTSLVLAQRLAARHGWNVGDRLALQGAHRPFVLQVQVSGVASASGVLADEAFCTAGLGQALAGHGPGQATLVRVRPQTEASKAALLRDEPRIEVVRITLQPATPAAGQVATVLAEGVNLGGMPGSRPLTLRVNGEGVGQGILTLGAFAEGAVAIPFIVPTGELRIQVNPEISATTTASDLTLAAPALSFEGVSLVVTLQGSGGPVEGAEIGLYPSLRRAAERTGALATASTDAAGQATFTSPGRDVVAATVAGPFAAASIPAGTDPTSANLTVEEAWLVPPDLKPGEIGRIHATVRNRGGVAGEDTIEVRRGDDILQFLEAHLESGAAQTIEAPFGLDKEADVLLVGGFELRLGTGPPREAAPEEPGEPAPPTPTPPGGTPVPPESGPPQPPPRAGQAAQAELADRVLGQARAVLLALGAVSLGTTLAVVVLGTRRALRSRTHVVGVLSALGQDQTAIRVRAAWEAGAMAGLCMLAVLPLTKLVFLVLAASWGPTAFGHALPDPIGWLFAVQAVAAFAGLAALAAYNVAGTNVGRPT